MEQCKPSAWISDCSMVGRRGAGDVSLRWLPTESMPSSTVIYVIVAAVIAAAGMSATHSNASEK
jgi:hypothetical protein